eukprot:g6298.t1
MASAGGSGVVTAAGEPSMCSETLNAAVMLADVSGFTKLTESLARQGKQGSETLTRILNAFYSQVIAVMQRCGGDVIKFAGDAVIATFSDRSSLVAGAGAPPPPAAASDKRVVVWAAHCAQEILSLVQSYPEVLGADGRSVKLGMHIGVGFGSTIHMLIGGNLNRWEAVCAGAALLQLGGAVGDAGVGEACLSEAAAAAAGNACVTVPVEGTSSRLITSVRLDLCDQSPPPLHIMPESAVSNVAVALSRFVP